MSSEGEGVSEPHAFFTWQTHTHPCMRAGGAGGEGAQRGLGARPACSACGENKLSAQHTSTRRVSICAGRGCSYNQCCCCSPCCASPHWPKHHPPNRPLNRPSSHLRSHPTNHRSHQASRRRQLSHLRLSSLRHHCRLQTRHHRHLRLNRRPRSRHHHLKRRRLHRRLRLLQSRLPRRRHRRPLLRSLPTIRTRAMPNLRLATHCRSTFGHRRARPTSQLALAHGRCLIGRRSIAW